MPCWTSVVISLDSVGAVDNLATNYVTPIFVYPRYVMSCSHVPHQGSGSGVALMPNLKPKLAKLCSVPAHLHTRFSQSTCIQVDARQGPWTAVVQAPRIRPEIVSSSHWEASALDLKTLRYVKVTL